MTMNVIPGSIQVLSKSPKKNKRLKKGGFVCCAPITCVVGLVLPGQI